LSDAKRYEKKSFVTAKKLGTKQNFVDATKHFTLATKRSVDTTKHFVVVAEYFCYHVFSK